MLRLELEKQKEADRKSQGEAGSMFGKMLILYLKYSVIYRTKKTKTILLAIDSAKELVNNILYISFAPILLLYLVCSWKKASIYIYLLFEFNLYIFFLVF